MAELDIFAEAINVAKPEPAQAVSATDHVAASNGQPSNITKAATTNSGFANNATASNAGTFDISNSEATRFDADLSSDIQGNLSNKKKYLLLGAGIISICSLGALFALGFLDGAVDSLTALVNEILGETEGLEQEEKSKGLALEEKSPSEVDGTKSEDGPLDPSNPYWSLPNYIDAQPPKFERAWTTLEEESWRAGLTHQFVYQRYKTVTSVRKAMLKGSEAILWDALEEKKFWTRMSALIGLAEFGIEVDLNTVEKAVIDARPALVHKYFQRLQGRNTTAAELYVARQVIRIADEKTRLEIIKGLYSSPADSLQKKYLEASLIDPSPQVKNWSDRLKKSKIFTAAIPPRVGGNQNGDEATGPEKQPLQEPVVVKEEVQQVTDDQEQENSGSGSESIEFFENTKTTN